MSNDFNWEPTSATGEDENEIYSELAGDETAQQRQGRGERRDPSRSPIHCFGGSKSIAAGATDTITCTPIGVSVRADRIEFSDALAALTTVLSIAIGGLPIMHGGQMPGDSFTARAQYGLRPAIPVTPNTPLTVGIKSAVTATTEYSVGVKGPTKR